MHPATRLATPQPLRAIALGDEHACLLDISGALRCLGANANGQLGDGTTLQRGPPGPVLGLR